MKTIVVTIACARRADGRETLGVRVANAARNDAANWWSKDVPEGEPREEKRRECLRSMLQHLESRALELFDQV